jgi:hypothetical protein
MRKMHMLGWMLGAVATAAASATVDIDRTGGNRPPVDLSAGTIRLEKIGGFSTGLFEEGGAEIAAYSRTAKRLFFVNAQANAVQALDLSDPAHPAALFTVDFAAYGGGVNSVATWGDLAAAAVEAEDRQQPGKVVFFDLSGHILAALPAGALPDMLTFTPDGSRVVVANEGEPKDYCEAGLANDPEGSVTIIDVPADRSQLAQAAVRTADFHGVFPALHPEVRFFGPNATPSQDLEPEYIAVADDSKTAYVTLQEANAIAVVDLANGTVTALHPLGTKDHSQRVNQLDASDRDGAVRLATWPVQGMYQPDSIAFYLHEGRRYLVTANEGDTRDYECYSELERVKDLDLDPVHFPNADDLQEDENIGRLRVTTAGADTDDDGDVDQLRSFGGRSFSSWTAQGQLIHDSGRDFEASSDATMPPTSTRQHRERLVRLAQRRQEPGAGSSGARHHRRARLRLRRPRAPGRHLRLRRDRPARGRARGLRQHPHLQWRCRSRHRRRSRARRTALHSGESESERPGPAGFGERDQRHDRHLPGGLDRLTRPADAMGRAVLRRFCRRRPQCEDRPLSV